MADPLSAAASAATKLGSVAAAHYSRGRDERRQVYRRFQEAVVVYVMQIRDSRLSPEALGLQSSERKPYIDALMKATTELAQALNEVRLVGNLGPIATAEALKQAINDSFDAAAARRENLTEDEVVVYAQAMHAFIEACRRDLWYQPPLWQLWRPSWWRARRQGGREKRARQQRESPTGPSVDSHTPAKGDVVFGVDSSNPERSSVTNCFDGRIAGTVTATVLYGGIVYRAPKNEIAPKDPGN
jgi:hypothetical protein